MLTIAQRQRIADILTDMHLPAGLGDEHNACSVAAINLALSGELTDDIPECMSEVIGKWIIVTQDAMPDALRNSPRWKQLLPLAAGTGRVHESERLQIIMEHMWTVALPLVQPLADERGFGPAWQKMTTERSDEAAQAAALGAAEAAELAAWAEAPALATAWAAALAAAEAASARAAGSWGAAALWAAGTAWGTLDPCALLERLIAVGEAK